MMICSKAAQGLAGAWNLVKTAHTWAGKKITDLTSNTCLPMHCMQKLYWSAPTMVPVLILPRYYTDFFVKPLAMMLPSNTVRDEFGDEVAHDFYAGIRNACLVHAAMDATQLAMTANPWLFISTIANLYAAALSHLEANPHLK